MCSLCFRFCQNTTKIEPIFSQKPIMSNKETNKPQTTSQKRNNQRPTMMYIIRRYLKWRIVHYNFVCKIHDFWKLQTQKNMTLKEIDILVQWFSVFIISAVQIKISFLYASEIYESESTTNINDFTVFEELKITTGC